MSQEGKHDNDKEIKADIRDFRNKEVLHKVRGNAITVEIGLL